MPYLESIVHDIYDFQDLVYRIVEKYWDALNGSQLAKMKKVHSYNMSLP